MKRGEQSREKHGGDQQWGSVWELVSRGWGVGHWFVGAGGKLQVSPSASHHLLPASPGMIS